MGITRREHEALALAEQGLHADAIAARMGIKPSSVKSILANLTVNLAEDRAHEAMMERGSLALLRALRRGGSSH